MTSQEGHKAHPDLIISDWLRRLWDVLVLNCITDRLTEWQRPRAAFYRSVWADHPSHCLPQKEEHAGWKRGVKDGEEVKQEREK